MQLFLRASIEFPLTWPVHWNVASGNLIASTIVITNVINKRIDTCRFTIQDGANTPVIIPYQEVIISDDGDTKRYFGGYISELNYRVEGITKVWDVQCQDYTVLLDRAIANEVYEDKTTAYILNDVFTTYLAEIDAATYVMTGKTYDWLMVNRLTLRQLVDKLAKENGFDWYVDYN